MWGLTEKEGTVPSIKKKEKLEMDMSLDGHIWKAV